jgi:hypothetical protein
LIATATPDEDLPAPISGILETRTETTRLKTLFHDAGALEPTTIQSGP